MFEVGKMYRYTGNGDTRFNDEGQMDYMKTGVHKVVTVSFSSISQRPRVKFSDDPWEQPWYLDPQDFEEAVERFFEVGKRYRYTGNGCDISVSPSLLKSACVVEKVGRSRPASEYVKFKELPCFFFVDPRNFKRIPEERMVFSIHRYMEVYGMDEKSMRKSEWPVMCDGKTAQEMRPFTTDDKWMVRESEFRPYVYKTMFVGFIHDSGRNAILLVPRTYSGGGYGYGYGLVDFREDGVRQHRYWGGDVYGTLEEAIAILPSKGCTPVYFDSLKDLMTWVVEGM